MISVTLTTYYNMQATISSIKIGRFIDFSIVCPARGKKIS